MDAQPKSRASVDRERNAKLLCELLTESEHLLRRQARQHAQLPEDAEDALQCAYLRFIERYRGDCEPLAWLYTTVKREAWAIRRKPSRKRELSIDCPVDCLDHDAPSARSSLRVFLRSFGERPLDSLDPTEAERWAREQRWAVPVVVTMLNDAVDKRLLLVNPFKGLSKKGPGRRHSDPLKVADVDRLAAIAGELHGQTMRSFVLFTAYSGLRVGEVFALRWEDIDLRHGRILVRRRLYRGELDLPKSNKAREIVLIPQARDALEPLDRSTEWIFTAKRGGQMTQSTLTYYWQGIVAAFGRPVTPHELKHFAGHYLYVTLGLPARVVAVQLAHAGPRLVEELYGHGDVGALDEIDAAFNGKIARLGGRNRVRHRA